MKGVPAGPCVPPPLVRTVTASHDGYFASFRQIRLDGFILAPATRPWSLTRLRLTSCILEHGVDAAPWAAVGSTAAGFVTLAFSGSPDSGLGVDGREISRDGLCAWRGASRVSIVARRPGDWFVVSVPDAAWAALSPPGPSFPEVGVTATPRRVRLADLARVRALASRLLEPLAAPGPEVSPPEGSPSPARRLLVELARLVSGPQSTGRSRSPRIARSPVLDHVEALLAARPSEPLYLSDLCTATGLPERTLRHIFVEQFGTSPIRFLKRRRLCQLRRDLERNRDADEGLARIAERHGFRHMGSLAADYRSLFGELPSETRRASGGFLRQEAGSRSDAARGRCARSAQAEAALAVGGFGR